MKGLATVTTLAVFSGLGVLGSLGGGVGADHAAQPCHTLPAPGLPIPTSCHDSTCRGPKVLSAALSATCQHCILTPQHVGHFLGVHRTVDVDIKVTLGNAVVATGTALFDATPDILTPDLGNVFLRLTTAPVSGVGTQTVTVEVTFTPRDTIDADPLLVERAEQYQTCFPSPPPPPSVFDATTFHDFYGTVFWAPGVAPAVPADPADAFMQHTMAYGNCPAAGTVPTTTLEDETTKVPAIPDVAAAVVGCYPANPALETCRKLRRCTPLEYESNAGSRAKHEDVECKTLAVCSSTDEFVVVTDTATTDRVCATKIERCSVDAGEVAVSGPEPMPACVPVEPCASTEYTAVGATSKSQPVCVQYGECDDTTEYEAVPKSRQRNRVCAPVSGACGRDAATPHRTTLAEAAEAAAPELADSYETAAPTASSDRVCAPTSVCAETDTLSAPVSASTDRQCATVVPPPSPGPAPPEPPPEGLPALIWGIGTTVVSGVWAFAANRREMGG